MYVSLASTPGNGGAHFYLLDALDLIRSRRRILRKNYKKQVFFI